MSETNEGVATPKTTRTRYNVSAEKFVEAYMKVYHAGGTNADLAKELNMPETAISARRSNYNRQRPDGSPGVGLPSLKRKSNGALQVSELQKVVKAEV